MGQETNVQTSFSRLILSQTAGRDPSLNEHKNMHFIKRVNDLSGPVLHSSARL